MCECAVRFLYEVKAFPEPHQCDDQFAMVSGVAPVGFLGDGG